MWGELTKRIKTFADDIATPIYEDEEYQSVEASLTKNHDRNTDSGNEKDELRGGENVARAIYNSSNMNDTSYNSNPVSPVPSKGNTAGDDNSVPLFHNKTSTTPPPAWTPPRGEPSTSENPSHVQTSFSIPEAAAPRPSSEQQDFEVMQPSKVEVVGNAVNNTTQGMAQEKTPSFSTPNANPAFLFTPFTNEKPQTEETKPAAVTDSYAAHNLGSAGSHPLTAQSGQSFSPSPAFDSKISNGKPQTVNQTHSEAKTDSVPATGTNIVAPIEHNSTVHSQAAAPNVDAYSAKPPAQRDIAQASSVQNENMNSNTSDRMAAVAIQNETQGVETFTKQLAAPSSVTPSINNGSAVTLDRKKEDRNSAVPAVKAGNAAAVSAESIETQDIKKISPSTRGDSVEKDEEILTLYAQIERMTQIHLEEISIKDEIIDNLNNQCADYKSSLEELNSKMKMEQSVSNNLRQEINRLNQLLKDQELLISKGNANNSNEAKELQNKLISLTQKNSTLEVSLLQYQKAASDTYDTFEHIGAEIIKMKTKYEKESLRVEKRRQKEEKLAKRRERARERQMQRIGETLDEETDEEDEETDREDEEETDFDTSSDDEEIEARGVTGLFGLRLGRNNTSGSAGNKAKESIAPDALLKEGGQFAEKFHDFVKHYQEIRAVQSQWEATYRQTKETNESLQQQYNSVWHNVGQLKEDLSIKEESLQELRQTLTVKEKECLELQQRLAMTENQLHSLREDQQSNRIVSEDQDTLTNVNPNENNGNLLFEIDRLRGVLQSKEEELQELNTTNVNLQVLVQNLQENKVRDVEERTLALQMELDAAQRQLQLTSAKLGQQDESVENVKKDYLAQIAKKNLEIASLQKKLADLREHFEDSFTKGGHGNGSDEASVDKAVMTQLFLKYIHSFAEDIANSKVTNNNNNTGATFLLSNLSKSADILRVISSILNWGATEEEEVGLIPGPKNPPWAPPAQQQRSRLGALFRRGNNNTNNNKNSTQPTATTQKGGKRGLASLWVDFLLENSAQPSKDGQVESDLKSNKAGENSPLSKHGSFAATAPLNSETDTRTNSATGNNA